MGATRVDAANKLTELLRRASAGDRIAANAAYEAMYPELLRMAQRLMQRQRSSHTLDAEGVVADAYLRVAGSGKSDWTNRGHFFAHMARAMRTRLIDYARQRGAQKRDGAAVAGELSGVLWEHDDMLVDLLTLDEVLTKLALRHPDAACVIELTYAVELTAAEVASAIEWSVRSVERELEFARTWIRAEFEK